MCLYPKRRRNASPAELFALVFRCSIKLASRTICTIRVQAWEKKTLRMIFAELIMVATLQLIVSHTGFKLEEAGTVTRNASSIDT